MANIGPFPKQTPSTDRQKSSFYLVVWPRNGSSRRSKMSGTSKQILEIF